MFIIPQVSLLEEPAKASMRKIHTTFLMNCVLEKVKDSNHEKAYTYDESVINSILKCFYSVPVTGFSLTVDS